MSQTFTCPKCGAPQDYQGGSAATIQCPYCETTLIVPPELRTGGAAASANTWAQHSDTLAEIKRLLANNQKIQAIKIYREQFGVGLKDAKDAVEAIERGDNVQVAKINLTGATSTPNIQITGLPGGIQVNTSVTRPANAGCTTAIVVVVVIVVLVSVILPFVVSGATLFNLFSGASPSIPTSVAQKIPTAAPSPTRVPTATVVPTPQFASAVQSFSKKGTAPGQLNSPREIAADGKGNIYVSEYTGARIQRFNAQGEFQDQWTGTNKTRLYGLAADLRGNVYAVLNGVITKFDGMTGKQLGQYAYDVPGDGFEKIAATPDGGLVGMFYEGANGIITSLAGHREYLVRFDRDGKATKTIKGIISDQTDNLELDNLLAVDTTGNIYILTSEPEDTIFKFSSDGKLITRFGSRGNDAGQMSTAYSIAADSKGRVYVGKADGIMVFSSDGRYIDTFRNNHDDAESMAFDTQDNLWVLSNDKITQFKLNK